jgi:signal transduction histidine kinase
MRDWLRGTTGKLLAFALICTLVVGGLGWTTAAALHLEDQQRADHAAAERTERLKLALWRLDSSIAPQLAVEDGRPFNHFSAVYAAPICFDNRGGVVRPGAVVEPSPLLTAELPEWMLLHFQLDKSGWESPQAPSVGLATVLNNPQQKVDCDNATPQRTERLETLKKILPPERMLTAVRERVAPALHDDKVLLPTRRGNEIANRAGPLGQDAFLNNDFDLRQQSAYGNGQQTPQRLDRSVAFNNTERNGENWLAVKNGPGGIAGAEVLVHLSPMTALWAPSDDGGERLLLARMVRIENKEVCQGILLDADYLASALTEKIADLFPDARLVPVLAAQPPRPELTMSALPFEMDPGPTPPPANPGWTPLRSGLVLSWAAALAALLVVGLVGRSLLDLSERRVRFVSAVTHELRTPLTTLRLYLDMLRGGLVRDETTRNEYMQTLDGETNRLSRLVGNVLDFSRLENQRPSVRFTSVAAAELAKRVQEAWQSRCRDADRELVVDDEGAAAAALRTDPDLVQQVLGNLLDNACKYGRGASDRRVWLRIRLDGARVAFDVADRGPGVPACERRAIFRPFRRGRVADATGGGVGLGLALARRWARMLGGKLTLQPAPAEGGACFRLTLPAAGTAKGC